MKKQYLKFTQKRIVVVSLFSGMDLFLLGMVKAGTIPGYAVERNFWAALMHSGNFKLPNGTPVIRFVNIPVEEYQKLRADGVTADTAGIIDDQYVRTISIQEVNGRDIRAGLESKFGKDIIIVVIGGPPCQDFTTLNPSRDTSSTGRNSLVFEYLRILGELSEGAGDTNVVGFMEEVPDFGSNKFSPIYSEFIGRAQQLPFHFAEQDMCALHYGGNQMRWRKIFQFVHKSFDALPVFPKPDTVNVKRVKDFLPYVEHFHSGHFTDAVKTKNHFMCTVTGGSPTYLESGGKKWTPTFDELLLCMDVESGSYLIPERVPVYQVKKAIGNGVCVSISYALGTTMIDKVLKLKHIGDGYFVPKDSDADTEGVMEDINPNAPAPVTETTTDLDTTKSNDQ